MNAQDTLQAAINFINGECTPNETLEDELKFASDHLYNHRQQGREMLHLANLLALYADYVATRQQAEIARLNARVAELEAVQQWIDPAVKLPDGNRSVLVLLEHYNMPSLQHQEITSFHTSPDFFNYEKHYEIVCSDECPTWARHFQCSFNHLQYTVKGWMFLPNAEKAGAA